MIRKLFASMAVIIAAFGVSIVASLRQEFSPLNGYLLDTDSYERLARIAASIKAGHLLYYVPGDNGNQLLPLHWTHLLDVVVISLSWPLSWFLGWQKALHFIGAGLGPLSLAAVSIAAILATDRICSFQRFSLLPAIFCISAPGLIGYGMFGRADHHVWLVFTTILLIVFIMRSLDREKDFFAAGWAGIIGGIGLWLSTEALPFVLLGWSFLLLNDAKQTGTLSARSCAFATTFSAFVVAAIAIDPPFYGYLSTPLDRISAAYGGLALTMCALTFLIRLTRFPKDQWINALTALTPAMISLGIWFFFFPRALQGPSGVLVSTKDLGFIDSVAEMQPIDDFKSLILFAFIPTLILVAALTTKIRKKFEPETAFECLIVIFLIIFAFLHVRFAIYLEAAAAIAAAALLLCLPSIVTHSSKIPRAFVVISVSFFIILGPILTTSLLKETDDRNTDRSCDPREIKTALSATAPTIVLTPINYAPAILYFSAATVVAGPYHRASDRIKLVAAAFAEEHFSGTSVPESIFRTGAGFILVCTHTHARPKTLEYSLAQGHTPSWAVEEKLPGKSGFRLLRVKP